MPTDADVRKAIAQLQREFDSPAWQKAVTEILDAPLPGETEAAS